MKRFSLEISFWSFCTETLKALQRDDLSAALTAWDKANDCVPDDASESLLQGRREILRRYYELIMHRQSGQKPVGAALFRDKAANVRLSLVTSVFNRLWQLKHTLPKNLETARNFPNVEIVLIDFGGADSDDISAMIDRDFSYDLLSGRLKYYRAIDPWKQFHMATAKNVAHRLACHEFLFSIDADNYVTPDDLNLVLRHFALYPDGIFHQTIGCAPLSHRQWDRYKLFPSPQDYHDNEVTWDGSCGRIGVSKKRFEMVNGYNENFVGMGMDDIDFLIRSIRTGSSYHHSQISRPSDRVFIDNGSAAKGHQHENNGSNWECMDASLANGVLLPFYITDSPLERFALYRPRAVLASANSKVTLFSSVFRASPYIRRFSTDLHDVLRGTPDVVIWLLDVVGSHSSEVSTALRELAQHERVYYFPVHQDPGLYALWNIAASNIRSTYLGNLNVDDLRGRDWLRTCLSMLDSGLADLASPVTVPFEDADVISYATALAALRHDGAHESRWFETRVILEGEPIAANPKHVPLEDGKYDHRDLFQVLPNGELASYCIPNASPVWRRELHERVGYFDEARFGCFADLALWLAAGAAGMRLRQVDYPALFFISQDQAHRRQVRDDSKLWSLALQRGSEPLRAWAGRRCFDLSRTGGSYGAHHFLGWNWVRDQVAAHFVSVPGNVLLDFFVERSFFWNPNPAEKGNFQFNRDWVGFVHTTPHESKVYENKGQNLVCLLEDLGFQRSLPRCRGLVVLSESNRVYLIEYLKKLGWSIPVFRTFHPNIPIDLSYADSVGSKERKSLEDKVFHIGWHLRSFAAFARLKVDKHRKVLLVPKKISTEYFIREVVNKDLALAGLKPIEEYVDHFYTASNEEYQKILRWGVIFNQYLEPAGSNLISECINAEASLMINRHSAFEEYLGQDYPLFFDDEVSADELMTRLDRPGYRKEVQQYMNKRQSMYSVEQFCRELTEIGTRVYEQYL
jgi:hypothetical protein